jgi:hypothetical protein
MKKWIAAFAVILSVHSHAQQDLSSQIDKKAQAIQSKLVEWRRYIHQHP